MRYLKILLVIETSGGGSGRHVVDLAEALANQGHDVSVIYSALRAESWFETEIAELDGIKVYRLPMHRAPHVSDIGAIRGIRGIILKEGPFDIVHGHSSKAGALSRLATVYTGCKTLYTPHALVTLDHNLSATKRLFYGSIERLLAPLSDALICVSSAEYSHATALGIADRRLRLVPNGIRPPPIVDRSVVRAELGLQPEQVTIGFVGRLDSAKAVDILISAFAIVAKTQPHVRLIIVGVGQDEPTLRRHAEGEGVAERILWAGRANGVKMMAAFDVFALPSDFEGLPYVLIEAAFRGLPIISTDVGGTAELVHDNYNGKIVPRGDVSRFAAALQDLVLDSALRETMGTASMEVGRSFTVENMAARTLEIYEELVSSQ